MADVNLPIQLAPGVLNEPILPGWQFSLFSINLGDSSDPDIEKAAIQKVGSYGKQIGHLAEALEVVIERLQLLDSDLAPEKKDALKVFLGDVAAARGVKRGAAKPPAGSGVATS
ncbi:MAG TPA: hypothetical protein VL358_02980 [Caulobacteraceae bacterium]|jgi:hypothetical protein|nr:hypothetical protein [Caulobacteraceae bacterium]